MTLSTFTSRFTIAMVSLGMGLAVLIFTQFSPYVPAWVEGFESGCIQTIFSSETRVTRYDSTSDTVVVHTLGIHPEKGKPFQPVAITDDPNKIFESTPPTPLDYAVILQRIHDRGFRSIVICTRMTWDAPLKTENLSQDGFDDSILSVQALSSKLALFDHSVIGLPVTRGPSSHPLPAPLKRSLISLSQISGKSTLIPTVNQVPLHSSIEGGENTLAGFHQIESSPAGGGKIQLLAQWNGQEQGLIPSIQLLAIMSAHNVQPSEIEVKAAQYIRLGTSGPVIPIDEYGQTPAPPAQSEAQLSGSLPATAADSLITENKQADPESLASTLAMIYANGELTASTNLINSDAILQIRQLSETLPIPGDAEHFQRLPFLLEALILLILGLLMPPLVSLTNYYRHLAFTLTAPLIIVLLLVLMEWNQQWFGLTAPLAAILTAWLTSSQFSSPTNQR